MKESDKLAPRFKVSVHMCCSEVQKGYILLDLTFYSFFVNRDVIFKEFVFPFSTLHSQQYKGLFVNNMISPELRSHVDNIGVPKLIQLVHSSLEIVGEASLDHESKNTFKYGWARFTWSIDCSRLRSW